MSSLPHRLCFFWMIGYVLQLFHPALYIFWLKPEATTFCLYIHRHLRITGTKDGKPQSKSLHDSRQADCIVALLAADADTLALRDHQGDFMRDETAAVMYLYILLGMKALEISLSYLLDIKC